MRVLRILRSIDACAILVRLLIAFIVAGALAPSAPACLTCGCRCLDAAPPEGWEIPQSSSDFGGSGGAGALPIQPGSWTLAIMPDTQLYAQTWPEHFYNQTQWIADHKTSHNIQYVLHEGDVVNVNSQGYQWVNARAAFETLDAAGVPYAIAPGNHDYGTARGSMFQEPENFGPGSPYASQSSIGGFFEAGKTDNSWHTFNANGQDWLIVTMEYGPRDQVVDWANSVVAAHPDHLAMMVTHAYMYNDDTIYDWATKGTSQNWSPYTSSYVNLPGGVNDGQELWDGLVKQHENFRLVFNGHVLGDGTGYRGTAGDNGNAVHQMLANYQFNTEGGQGDMRLLEFLADGETVIVRTYSPSLDRYDMAPDQTFTLNLNQLPPTPPVLYHAVSANLVAIGPTDPSDGTVNDVQVPQTGSPPVGVGQRNGGDFQVTVDGKGLNFSQGILLASITQHDRPDFLNRRSTVEAGRNPFGDGYMSLSIMEAGVSGDNEVNFNTSAAWFAFEGGWIGAHVNADGTVAGGASNGVLPSQVTKTGTGRYTVNMGTGAQNDGMLFVIGNNNDDIVVQTGLLPGGSAWDIRTQDGGADFSATGEDKDWSFLYLPYDTPDLIGGYYDGIANSNIQSAGNFTMNRLATGQYELTVNGQTPDTGMLIMSLADEVTVGPTTAPNDNILVYQPSNGKFLINSYDITGSGTTLENTKFAWAFIGFEDPISQPPPPGASDFSVLVNRTTNTISLTNDGVEAVDIKAISILSSNGALIPANWDSISTFYDETPGDGSVDPDDPWTVLSSTVFNLREREESGGNGGSLDPDETVDFGDIWKRSRLEDIVFQIELADGSMVLASVGYSGGPNGGSYLRSDLNTDGFITAADWSLFYPNMLANLSSMTGVERALAGDIDGDGDNDVNDFVLFKTAFEAANGAGSFNSMLNGVPEPSTAALLAVLALIGAVSLHNRRR